jgi:hypothetical protein
MYKYPVPFLDPLLAALQTTRDGLPAKTIHVLEAKCGLDVPMCLSSSIMNCYNLAMPATAAHPVAAVLAAQPAPSQAGDEPASDGPPRADHAKPCQWMVTLTEHRDALLSDAWVSDRHTAFATGRECRRRRLRNTRSTDDPSRA